MRSILCLFRSVFNGTEEKDVLKIPAVFPCVVTLVERGALLRTLPAFFQHNSLQTVFGEMLFLSVFQINLLLLLRR